MPIDDNKYRWNEQTLSWDIVEWSLILTKN
jgi:hypothetical protein